MFDDLLDDANDGDVAGPPPAPPPPPPALAPPRGRARGRGRGGRGVARGRAPGRGGRGDRRGRVHGFIHTNEAKLNMKATRNKLQKQRCMNQVAREVSTSKSKIIRRGFGSGRGSAAKSSAGHETRVILTDADTFVHDVNGLDTYNLDLNMCTLSHVTKQASGLATYIKRPLAKSRCHTIVFDDASMWLKKPPRTVDTQDIPAMIAAAPLEAQAKLQRHHRPRGRMMHTPVLNSTEHVFLTMDPVDGDTFEAVAGALVHSPATALPKANHFTVRERLERWTIGNCGRPGRSVDPAGELEAALRSGSVSWSETCCVRDCLPLNSNIIYNWENKLEDQRVIAVSDAARDSVSTLCLAKLHWTFHDPLHEAGHRELDWFECVFGPPRPPVSIKSVDG